VLLGGRLRFDSCSGYSCLPHLCVQTGSGPHISLLPANPSPGVNRPEREFYHSPPCSAKVKNAWNLTSTLPHVFMTWCISSDALSYTIGYRTNGNIDSVFVCLFVSCSSLSFVSFKRLSSKRLWKIEVISLLQHIVF
jgi:hypothetical protein